MTNNSPVSILEEFDAAFREEVRFAFAGIMMTPQQT